MGNFKARKWCIIIIMHHIMPPLKPVSGMNGLIAADLTYRTAIITTKKTKKDDKVKFSGKTDKQSARGRAQDHRKRTSPKTQFNI